MSAEPKAELGKLRTEQVDEKFHLLDIMSIGELLKAMPMFLRRSRYSYQRSSAQLMQLLIA